MYGTTNGTYGKFWVSRPTAVAWPVLNTRRCISLSRRRVPRTACLSRPVVAVQGEDGGVEATTRMRSSGLGFEGWYGTPKQLKGNSMGLSDTAVTTQIPREYDDPVAKRHVIQKDHWFMGAKYPNPHTLREDIREAYYTVRGGLPTAGGEEASR